DGEAIRRIAVAGGEARVPPHDVTDTGYWQTWSKEQVEIKRIMGARGIKVDMAGTWVRLLAHIESLSPADYARWLEIDPQATARRDADFIPQLQAWRKKWEQSLPWWRKLQRRLRSIWTPERP
ncbi:MAG: hypothetical protein R3264_09295, partial [Anaerolineae bacterium]|nr:hypothetical protein [Anaerolineae bacterium]